VATTTPSCFIDLDLDRRRSASSLARPSSSLSASQQLFSLPLLPSATRLTGQLLSERLQRAQIGGAAELDRTNP
jgi:hypothetical protein